MIVICKNNKFYENEITINKVYEVIGEQDKFYLIIDDNDLLTIVDSCNFIIIKEV